MYARCHSPQSCPAPSGQSPAPTNNALGSWPDVRDYTATYQTAYSNLGNGQPAKLFSSYDQQTVNTHFQWMQQNGCDTAALQRFNPTGGEGPTRDAMAAKVRQAAEQHGRKFYIMYDATGWTNMQSEMKADVPAGWSVTIYAEDNFTGQSWTRTADTPNFVALSPNANDHLTSCRIQ
ncbi:hypothetical protein [Kribbella sp. VKM Ac-2568]|uniref:hypothetical protein n=1 Tax=Kribbella sp. VKM Ac-2568 TaxID=2512219 RepID=UPI0010E12F5E|nr:hypothetical protein [Kribbella sp. VKM Ac-2568]TCM44454.1 hypothetical protein EV648_108326 [Kribbella sp. VKM Ac-2568]